MSNRLNLAATTLFLGAFSLALASCVTNGQLSLKNSASPAYVLHHQELSVEFDDQLRSRVVSKVGTESQLLGDFRSSEYVQTVTGDLITDFAFQGSSESQIETELGSGQQVVLSGVSEAGLQKDLTITSYENYPTMLFFSASYTNLTDEVIRLRKWVNNDYNLEQGSANPDDSAAFWSYEGASYQDRRDWVKPLDLGYAQENYMGMNASDYGSGTAIVDVWRKDIGMAVGHSETSPKLVALPLHYRDASTGAELRIEMEKIEVLNPDDSMQTIETFVNVHQGDYYATLKNYRTVMADKGLVIDEAPESAYEPIWCAWGYERDFSVDEVLATLPKVKELGLEWAVLDDGWQTSEGDWYLHPDKFPNGDADMQAFVDEIHAQGLKAKLWWAPLAVDPGTDLLHQNTDMLLLGEWGEVQDISWWNSFYLCPAYDSTLEYTKELVKTMLGTWGFDGLKIDGQHLNGVPPCHNPEHNHDSPTDSVEHLAEFWKVVYDTAMEINPEAVVEICPCGTSYAFHNLPFMNQTVSSDPLSSWQIRHKGKTLKGLMGDSAPYYGDHVELSDNASDFASSFGIGGILGTKFTMGVEEGPGTQYLLDAEKEVEWEKWISLYNEMRLAQGVYLGELYDIGYDLPETHAIQKDNRLYYAFYAEDWDSSVEFRGLSEGAYQVRDYVNNIDLGVVEGPLAKLDVEFETNLLLELIPLTQMALTSP